MIDYVFAFYCPNFTQSSFWFYEDYEGKHYEVGILST